MAVTINGDGTITGLNLYASALKYIRARVSTNAVLRWISDKLDDSVSVRDFGAVGDGVVDDTVALQRAVDACTSDAYGGATRLNFGSGKYRITSPITVTKQYFNFVGDDMMGCQILCDNVAGGGLKFTGNVYFRGAIRELSIMGNASTGPALDLSGVTSQFYSSLFSRLYLRSGGTAFYAPGSASLGEFFNNKVELVHVHSYNGHGFHVANGPGTTYQNCYAVEVPAGKAGYRMVGLVTLINCNGLNEGDVWGAFGSNPSGTDGFQGDFAYVDYPSVTMIGCNVERFGSRTTNGIGVRLCQLYRELTIIGGAFQRADSDIPLGPNSYKAVISCYGGPNQSGNPVRFGASALYLRDVVNGTGANTPSLDHFHFETGGHLEDTSLIAEAAGITTYNVVGDGVKYPTTRRKLVNDVYGGFAEEHRALSPRRISLQMERFNLGAVLTPVGTNQAINVTGRTKVVVTAAAAASVSTATFAAVPGAGDDYGRNGRLIIESTNGNLTIVHSASGANTFKTLTGANVVVPAGGIITFLRSETNGNWLQQNTPI